MTDYPPAPWAMVGQLWLSVFLLRGATDRHRRAGVYVAAFATYQPGSPLTYSELVVARAVRTARPPRATVTDIWVDSPASRAGGRELWAIPKDLCDFELDTVRRGPATTTEWTATSGGRPVASATFTDVAGAAPRVPLVGSLGQPGIEETRGAERTAPVRGSARVLPCRGRWDLAADGPLAWLRPAHRLASFRLADFRISFG